MIVDGVFTVGHYLWYALPLLSLILIEHGPFCNIQCLGPLQTEDGNTEEPSK